MGEDNMDRDHCPRCGEAWRKRAIRAEAEVERLRKALQMANMQLRIAGLPEVGNG